MNQVGVGKLVPEMLGWGWAFERGSEDCGGGVLADVGPGAVSVVLTGPRKTACSWCQVHGCMLSLTALETGKHRGVGLSLRNMFSFVWCVYVE